MAVHTEYYFRVDMEGGVEITKFTGGTLPVATYHVFLGASQRIFCDCPAGSNGRHCKHVRWTTAYLLKNTLLPKCITVDKKGNENVL